MAIKGNRQINGGTDKSTGSSNLFSKQEASFVASKLQQASFQGAEFDLYFKIMQKLKELIDKG
ncbi:MAG: hypothetical protein ACKVJK_02955 [Methylophagaceae bacterium]